MATSRKSRLFRDWAFGPSGSMSTLDTESNSYNAQVYDNGALGPRPGWKAWTNGGTPLFDVANDGIRGILWRRDGTSDAEELLIIYADASNANALTVQEGDITTTPGTIIWGTATVTGVGNTVPNGPERVGYADQLRVNAWFDGINTTIISSKVYDDFPSTGSITTTANGEAACLTRYRERMYYWGIDSTPGRVYYSDAGDYSTVGATAFFDISDDPTLSAGSVVGMWSVQNGLLIARKDNTWFVLTGTSPENGTLKELSSDRIPDYLSAAVVDNQLFYLSPTGNGANTATPSGIDTRSLEYLAPSAHPEPNYESPDLAFQPEQGIGDDLTRAIFLPARPEVDADSTLALEYVNDSWAFSIWDMDDYTTVEDTFFTRGRPNRMWALLVTDTPSWVFYSREHTLNRPAKATGDTYSRSLTTEDAAAAAAQAVVQLGEISSATEALIRPTKVVLDVDYWKGGTFSDPSLLVDADTLGTTAATSEDSATQQSISTAAWANTTGTTPSRRRIEVPLQQLQYGQSCRITLRFDGLSIRQARVYYDEQEDIR